MEAPSLGIQERTSGLSEAVMLARRAWPEMLNPHWPHLEASLQGAGWEPHLHGQLHLPGVAGTGQDR